MIGIKQQTTLKLKLKTDKKFQKPKFTTAIYTNTYF